jgi:hypothetical protein
MKPLILLLFLPLTLSAQVTLTPMEVRRANVLLDELDRRRDERVADSLEIAAWMAAFAASEALRMNLENTVKEQANGLRLSKEREDEWADAFVRSGKKAKRNERLAWVLGGIATAEAVVIGITYGLR